jgi:hypothetical protein
MSRFNTRKLCVNWHIVYMGRFKPLMTASEMKRMIGSCRMEVGPPLV